jgi:hypothetical protein
MSSTVETASGIRPFHVDIPEGKLTDLRRRIAATNWPENETVADASSRLYWEYKGGFFNTKGVSIPVAVSVFPGEQYQAPRSWAERAYPHLIYYNQVARGGHFAAWEQPRLFSQEIRTAFRPFR